MCYRVLERRKCFIVASGFLFFRVTQGISQVSRSLKVTLAFLVAIFVVTNAFPELMLLVLIFTLGLGLPLLFVNTILLYFVAALPALILRRQEPRRWAVIWLAAVLVPTVAVVPPLAAQALAAWKMRGLRANDVEARFLDTPESIELVGDPSPFGGAKDFLRNAPCDELCQRLLLSGRVDRVRVTRTQTEGAKPRGQMDYVIERRANCPDAFADGQTLLSQTKDAVASGTCFVAHAPEAASFTARIVVRKKRSSEPANLQQDLAAFAGAVTELQSLEIFTPDQADWALKFRQTQVKYSHWRMPLYLTFAPCYGLCIGKPVFGRTTDTINPFDPAMRALHALNIVSAKPQDRLSPAARVMAILDGAGDTLTENQRQLINEWAKGLPCKSGTCPSAAGEDERVLMRIVKDRRVTDFIFIRDVLARSRHLLVEHFDIFLDEMEGRGANSQFTNTVGALVAQLDHSLVRSRRDRIFALIRENEWKWSRGIGIISGQLGFDVADLIVERLGHPTSAYTAALAACLADEEVGRALVPKLLEYLRSLSESQTRPNTAHRDVIKALARFGYFEEAREIYVARFPKTGEQSLPRHSAEAVVHDIKACYRA